MSTQIDKKSSQNLSPLLPIEDRKEIVKPINNSISFNELLDQIRIAFSRPDKRVDIDDLWRVLESYKSNPSDWSKYAFYDYHRYKRNFVDGQDNYNVMVLCWPANAKSCIHDHSGSHCFMKILDGELVERQFAWPKVLREHDLMIERAGGGDEMKLIGEAKVGKNEVLYINDKVGLHQVLNPNPNRTAASLHIYIPPIRNCRAFDQRTGQYQECKLTFYSKRGKITGDEENEQEVACAD